MEVLLVTQSKDDLDQFERIFKDTFNGFELKCLDNGQDAIDYLRVSNSPAFTIVEREDKGVVDQIKHHSGQRPIVFLGEPQADFGEISTLQVINKPIVEDQLKTTLLEVTRGLRDNLVKSQAEKMGHEERLPIKIKNFYRLKEIPYDVYLKLSEVKFIKIINKNEPFTSEVVNKFVRKKIKFFYLKKQEHLQFLESTIKGLMQIFDTPTLAFDNAVLAQVNAVQIIHEYVRTIGVDDKIIALTKKVIETTSKIYSDNSDLDEIIGNFPFKDKDVAEQAILVAYICEGLLLKMDWGAEQTRLKLGLAAILHDCMLADDDLIVITSLKDPNLAMFSQELQEQFKKHPSLGAEIASDYQTISDAEFLISQHHEMPDGSGFPGGLNSSKLPALSCVFILANNFVGELCQRGAGSVEMQKILKVYQKVYDVGNFKAPLKQLLMSLM